MQARKLHRQLDSIAHAMNVMQDNESTLVDAYGCWLDLLEDESILESTNQEMKRRFAQVIHNFNKYSNNTGRPT